MGLSPQCSASGPAADDAATPSSLRDGDDERAPESPRVALWAATGRALAAVRDPQSGPRDPLLLSRVS